MLERFKLATESHSETKLSVVAIWQSSKEVYSNKFMWTKLDYIHLNPVGAGIVEKAFALRLFQCHKLCF
jgi:hypothetical protein